MPVNKEGDKPDKKKEVKEKPPLFTLVSLNQTSRWQQLKLLFRRKTVEEQQNFWGRVVRPAEEKEEKEKKGPPVKVRYYQPSGAVNNE